MSSGGNGGPQMGFLVNVADWFRERFGNGRAKSAAEAERDARQARIDARHRAQADVSSPPQDQPHTDTATEGQTGSQAPGA